MSVLTTITPRPAAGTVAPSPGVPDQPVMRLAVEQYHQMICAGILTAHDRIELLEGWLVPKMPQNPPHVVAAELTAAALIAVKLPGWCVRSEKPITLPDSEPEPDVVLTRGSTRDYAQRHPAVEDLALVVEVADATLAQDRRLKRRIYARAKVPTYWIVNVVDRQVEVYTAPSGPSPEPAYGNREDFKPGTAIPLKTNGAEIARLMVDELLP
jgi:Uma2 family endonuclease